MKPGSLKRKNLIGDFGGIERIVSRGTCIVIPTVERSNTDSDVRTD
jgi:hypothetical protein